MSTDEPSEPQSQDLSQPTLQRTYRVMDDPPIVVFEEHYKNPFVENWERLRDLLGEPAYGATRVFDLFTLMAITLAFGLLFGAMKALGAIPEVFFGVATYVTFVGIGQMLLFGGNNPRLASVVGGPIALLLTTVLLNAWYGRWDFCTTTCSLVLGPPAGYLAGGMVAGVFLIADAMRKKLSRPPNESEVDFWNNDEA